MKAWWIGNVQCRLMYTGREAPLSCFGNWVRNNYLEGFFKTTPSAMGKMVQIHHGAATVSGE